MSRPFEQIRRRGEGVIAAENAPYNPDALPLEAERLRNRIEVLRLWLGWIYEYVGDPAAVRMARMALDADDLELGWRGSNGGYR